MYLWRIYLTITSPGCKPLIPDLLFRPLSTTCLLRLEVVASPISCRILLDATIMDTHMEDDTHTENSNEQEPLLAPQTAPQPGPDRNCSNAVVIYAAISVIFLFQAAITAPTVPSATILQDALCRRSGLPTHCRDAPVQSELAMLKGVASFAFMIPAITLTVPYGALADKYGTLRFVVLALLGILMGEAWSDLLYFHSDTWPLRLLWLTPIFYLVGGGPAALVSQLFCLVTEASLPASRLSNFYRLEAAAYLGNILALIASSVLMKIDVWAPLAAGIALIILAPIIPICLSATSPSIGEPGNQTAPQPQQPTDVTEPAHPKRLTAKLASLARFVKTRRASTVLLAGYWLRMLAVSVTRIQLIYVAAVFGWEYAEAAYIVSLDNAVHLAVLLLFPAVDSFFARHMRSSTFRNAWLARFSALCTLLGCAGIALSPSPPVLTLSVVVFGLGAGYSSSVRALLVSHTQASHHNVLFSTMSTLDTAGTLLGALLWPTVFDLGMKREAFGAGLPFGVAAVFMSLVLVSVMTPLAH
ncbi:MFS general substrate transporter [Xylariaceae sp. FL0804]|nr:MFS general substrate transporter [Xylariaceae sp. FL0804]